MKKIFTLVISTVVCSIASQAQFTKGQQMIGGSLGISSRNIEQRPTQNYDQKNFSVSAKPYFAWFISANKLAGVSLEYSRSVNTQTNYPVTTEYKNVYEAAGASVFIQRFFTVVPRLYFTLKGGAGANYLFGKSTTTSPSSYSEGKQDGFEAKIAVSPGLSYQLTNRFLLDLSFNDLAYVAYNRSVYKTLTPTTNATKGIEQNFNLSSSLNSNLSTVGLGFRWLLK